MAVTVGVLGAGMATSEATVAAPVLITTIAGTGTVGYDTGSGGVATTASFGEAAAVGDADGNYYVAEYSTCHVRKIDRAGLVHDVAGTASCGFSGDGGLAPAAQLDHPAGIARDGAGNLYVADQNNCAIRRIDATTLLISTVAGVGGQCGTNTATSATAALLDHPAAVAVDVSGNLVIADRDNCRIRKVTSGTISTIAGTGTCANSDDTVAQATAKTLNKPEGVAVDSQGRVYLSDTLNQRVRKINVLNQLVTLAGPGAGVSTPKGLDADVLGTVFVADAGACRVHSIAASVTTVAGTGTCADSNARVLATSATLASPRAVTVTPAGDLVVGDGARVKVVNRAAARPIGVAAQHTGLTQDWRTYANSNGSLDWSGRNYSGGDATYSLPLPNGKVAWLYGDSYVGAPSGIGFVNANHTRNTQYPISNQLVVQTPSSTGPSTFVTRWRTGAVGSEFFVNPTAQHGFWPSAPWLKDTNTMSVLLRDFDRSAMAVVGISIADVGLANFTPTGAVALPAAFPANPQYTPTNGCDAHLAFGDAVLVDPDGYTYIYGSEACQEAPGQLKNLHVWLARVQGTDLVNGTWTYYTGNANNLWSANSADANRLQQSNGNLPNSDLGNVAPEFSVVRAGTGYRMVTQHVTLAPQSVNDVNKVVKLTASSPAGPFSATTDVYTVPEIGAPPYQGADPACLWVAYNPKEHPEFEAANEIVVSYNVGFLSSNHDCTPSLMANVDNYRPRFITVRTV